MQSSGRKRQSNSASRLILIGIWTVFTVSLAIWWYIYSVRQLDRSAHVSPFSKEEALRERKMLTLEGVVLIVCLVGGGGALAYYVLRDLRQQRKLMDFFLTFTHELKTPLTNIQLQAENLTEKLTDPSELKLAQNLLNETARLTLQLENSLYLASENSSRELLLEKITLSEVVRELIPEYPSLSIKLTGDETLLADRSALLTILRNIARNAVIHGGAHNLQLTVLHSESISTNRRVRVICTDNGSGFQGNVATLGIPFQRHSTNSGSGLGLYICKRLAKLMDGDFQILPLQDKLKLVLTLKEATNA